MTGHVSVSFSISGSSYRSACVPECSLAGIVTALPYTHTSYLAHCGDTPSLGKSYELQYLMLTRTISLDGETTSFTTHNVAASVSNGPVLLHYRSVVDA